MSRSRRASPARSESRTGLASSELARIVGYRKIDLPPKRLDEHSRGKPPCRSPARSGSRLTRHFDEPTASSSRHRNRPSWLHRSGVVPVHRRSRIVRAARDKSGVERTGQEATPSTTRDQNHWRKVVRRKTEGSPRRNPLVEGSKNERRFCTCTEARFDGRSKDRMWSSSRKTSISSFASSATFSANGAVVAIRPSGDPGRILQARDFLQDTPPQLRRCRHRLAGRGRFPTISTGPPDRAGERTGLVEPRRDRRPVMRAARSSVRPPSTSRDGDSRRCHTARLRCGRPARTGTELCKAPLASLP